MEVILNKNLLFILFILFIQNIYSQSITGILTSCNNTQLKRADIQILSNALEYPKPIIKTIRLSDNGEFKIILDKPGFYQIRFCGVDHQPLEVPFFINSTENIDVKVKIVPNYVDEIKELKIIGDFNKFSWGKSAKKMEKDNDDNYVAEIKTISDTLAYQIIGMSNRNHSVNYSQADYFILDNGGDYISVLKTKNDTMVTIKVDKMDLLPSNCQSEVVWNGSSNANLIYYLIEDLNKRKSAQKKSLDEYEKTGGDRTNFNYDWTKDIQGLLSLSQKSPVENKAFYYWAIAELTGKSDSANSREILQAFPENSPIWSISPNSILQIISNYSKEEQLKYLIRFYDENKDETIKPFIINSLLNIADEMNENDIVKKYFEIFENKYSDSMLYEILKNRYSSARRIKNGEMLPSFSFISVDDSTVQLDNSKINGKIYLIDFWATWCGPCIGEMESIHNAYEKYKSKGLNIISVSLDFAVEDMMKFRKEKWPLPWFNAFMKYDPNNQIIKDFELISIPKPILVDGNGIIIATDMALRGDRLDKTLSQFLNK